MWFRVKYTLELVEEISGIMSYHEAKKLAFLHNGIVVMDDPGFPPYKEDE